MESKKISRERWQGMCGTAPQEFHQLVQTTLKKTREAPAMKRFTLRTALLVILCLLLLTGIALAAAGVFGTKNSLGMYTSAPKDGAGVDIQTDLNQIGGDFPDLTVTVRDAVYDGVTAYVTVEYRAKNPEQDMLLCLMDAYFQNRPESGRWPGYSSIPLSDPLTDPRRKLAVDIADAMLDGIRNTALPDFIYESDGVLVGTFRIRLDSDALFEIPQDPAAVFTEEAGVIVGQYTIPFGTPEPAGEEEGFTIEREAVLEPTPRPQDLTDLMEKLRREDTLDLTLKTALWLWDFGAAEKPWKELYSCDVSVTLRKTDTPVTRMYQTPCASGDMTLTNVRVSFTKLATYMDISSEYPLGLGVPPDENADPEDDLLGSRLVFDWVDGQGNVITRLGQSSLGTYDAGDKDGKSVELNHYTAFWPAVMEVPETITLRAVNLLTGETLAAFTLPLVRVPEETPVP